MTQIGGENSLGWHKPLIKALGPNQQQLRIQPIWPEIFSCVKAAGMGPNSFGN